MKKQIIDRYARTSDNQIIIEIAVGKVGDLYNDLDKHTPYSKKELDPDLAEYLIDSVREIGKEDFVIQFRLAEIADSTLKTRVKKSIHNYFLYLKELENRQLVEMTRSAFILFAIGVAILFLSVWINQKIADYGTVTAHVFAEGLNVAAWVSLWNAIATFLLYWTPHRRQIKMYERINKAKILFYENPGDGL